MPIEITVPRLGWSMEEGTFAAWLKEEGDTVQSGDLLFAVESDKVTMDVESLDSGTLHIPADAPQPGEVVTVGQRLGYLLAEGEAAPVHSTPEAAPPTPSDVAPAAAAAAIDTATTESLIDTLVPAPEEERHISPRAAALALNLGIDISRVTPRPGARRIVEADVRRSFQSRSAASPRAASRVVSTVGKTAASSVRKLVAARMEESFRTPHFYVQAEADATSLAKLRDELLPLVEAEHHVRLTYNDFLIKALAMAVRAQPNLNSYWEDGEIVSRSAVNIGLAVQVNDNLLVPVIHDASQLTIGEIAVARHELVDKCLRSAIRLPELEDGSITVSNLGPFGVDRFQAILDPPQSAIVAVGRIAKRPYVEGDNVVARLTVPLSISVDHRVIDGVAAAAFLREIVGRLESPFRLALPPSNRPVSS